MNVCFRWRDAPSSPPPVRTAHLARLRHKHHHKAPHFPPMFPHLPCEQPPQGWQHAAGRERGDVSPSTSTRSRAPS